MMKDPDFELSTAADLRARYGLTAENRPQIRLDPQRVPPTLRQLIPWAELWGVADDLIREDMIRRMPKDSLVELNEILDRFADDLDAWLAGPEADEAAPSDEYVAFSAMRMAGDAAR